MLSPQDLQNIQTFLGRSQISGDESAIMMQLRQKIAALLIPQPAKKEASTEEARSVLGGTLKAAEKPKKK